MSIRYVFLIHSIPILTQFANDYNNCSICDFKLKIDHCKVLGRISCFSKYIKLLCNRSSDDVT